MTKLNKFDLCIICGPSMTTLHSRDRAKQISSFYPSKDFERTNFGNVFLDIRTILDSERISYNQIIKIVFVIFESKATPYQVIHIETQTDKLHRLIKIINAQYNALHSNNALHSRNSI